jgi:aminoglycoside/choline kinase family phosphotransferase
MSTPPTAPTVEELRTLAGRCVGIPVRVLGALAGGGSERAFHRLEAAGQPLVGAIGRNLAEVRAFLGFTAHLAARGIPVPRILGADAARGLYLMDDLGEATLARRLAQWRADADAAAPARAALEAALETTVRWLPAIQVRGGEGLDESLCWEGRALDAAAFRRDAERFLRHYVPRFGLHPAPVDDAVRADLETLIARLDALPRAHFCYRDFQARNVMWVRRAGERAPGPVFLDYQSGRRGPLAYDLASLLYSPDTGADEPLREQLVDVYLAALAQQGVALARAEFLAGFRPIVLLRRLQALGRYAELGTVHKRAVFLDKIPPALAELRALQAAGRLDFGLPALQAWLARVIAA